MVNYATEADLQNETGVDTSDFAKKADLKSNADKLDIQKLKNVLIGLKNWKVKWINWKIGKTETTPVDLNKLKKFKGLKI